MPNYQFFAEIILLLNYLGGRRPQEMSHLPIGPIQDNFKQRREWVDMTSAQQLQGLVAHDGQEQRVYTVTIRDEHKQAFPRII